VYLPLPYRILLVEDDDSNAQIMRIMCDQAGWEVVMARNGAQALEVIARQSVDLVLTDVRMPIMDGIEAARRIRSSHRTRHMPIVFVTAMAMSELRSDIDAVYPAAILIKPFRLQELSNIIRRCL
jgi:CheY-like chemotaxis protein